MRVLLQDATMSDSRFAFPSERRAALPSLDEVEALIRYAAENGSAPSDRGDASFALASRLFEEVMSEAGQDANDANDTKGLAAATQPAPGSARQGMVVSIYQRLRKQQADQTALLPRLYGAVAAYRAAEDPAEQAAAYGVVLELYARLTRLTAPVTGRTIRDTKAEASKKLRTLLTAGLVLLVLGLALQVLQLRPKDVVLPTWFDWLSGKGGAISHVTPFVWGAIGSIVYLLKYLYDIAQIQAFDASRYQGIGLRICLGAIVGGVTLQIFDATAFGSVGTPIDRDAFAFLAGLGVRVVYGAMEKTIQLLSDKLNLESVRATQMKGRPSPKGAEG